MNESEAGELFLTTISENTGGAIILPEDECETIKQTTRLAQIIDSQYVVTYVPKWSLRDSPKGEVRLIEVNSRRNGLQVEVRRRLIVQK